MRDVIDTATWQRGLNFALPFADGFRDVYVKMGGDNDDPTYEAPLYEAQVDAAIAAGFEHVGHYWVPNGDPSDADTVDTPTEQADFMLERLHRFDPVSGFIVLDNENLDGSIRLTDAQAAEFVERVKERRGIRGRQVFFYTNLSDARAHEWPLLLDTGVQVIMAAPSYPPGTFAFPNLPTIPADRIVGHQHGTRTWGGVVTDVNTFTDDAFDYGGSTVSYVNVDNWQVILINGVRDANVSWAEHVARGSAGGVDCVALTPKPIHAPAAGRIEFAFNNGSGGHTATLHQAGGWRDQFMHLSAFEGVGGRQVRQGDLIGYTGRTVAPGYPSVSPHLHWHRIDPSGARRNPWHYFTAAPASGGYTPILNGADIMALRDSLEIIHTPRGWFLSGPATWYEFANQDGVDGGVKLSLFKDVLKVPVTELSTGDGDTLRIVILGNQAAADNARYSASLVDAGITETQLDELAAKVAASIPAGTGPTAEAIAAAVREKLRTDPLK